MTVEAVRTVDEELLEACARLLPQLSSGALPLGRDALTRLVTAESNTLLVARLDGVIMGMLTLVMFPIPSGLRAWIEDVVVDLDARGHGLGASLTQEAVRLAGQAGARTVDLTSRPSRPAANRLYESLGFVRRDSVVYRLSPGAES